MIKFTNQARGSLFETINDLVDANDCKYISVETLNEYKQKAFELEKLLNGYIAWLKRMITLKPN